MTSYNKLISKLYKINSERPVKLDLSNMKLLYDAIGRPLDNIPVVHVAGTNGKGSVCYKVAHALMASNMTTGLFVSPHISSFGERMQVNGQPIYLNDIMDLLPKLFDICEKNDIPATFFELTTALAFMQFKSQRCDVAVIEVGLGGRLDATNIINSSVVTVITSIQYDHVKILGDTKEKIATEKAGIMRPSVPVLVGDDVPKEHLNNLAEKCGSPFYTVHDILEKEEFLHPSIRQYHAAGKYKYEPRDLDIFDHEPLAGNIAEITNVNLAKAVLKLLKSDNGNSHHSQLFQSHLKNNKLIDRCLLARPPCRFEIFEFNKYGKKRSEFNRNIDTLMEVVLDIAHNEDAFVNLIDTVKQVYKGKRPLRIVFGMSADKDIRSCANLLATLVDDIDKIYCVEAMHPRAASKAYLQETIKDAFISLGKTVSSFPDVTNSEDNIKASVRHAIDASLEDSYKVTNHLSTDGMPVVLVCGSAYIMSQVRDELGVDERRDANILVSMNLNRDTQHGRTASSRFIRNSPPSEQFLQEMGTVDCLESKTMRLWDGTAAEGVEMTIRTKECLKDSYIGCSIAVNGVCLTATTIEDDKVSFGVAPETLRRTNLGMLKQGSRVNLERALPANGRNSGHFVQGHVDCTGKIIEKWREGESLWVKVQAPSDFMKYIVPKGFISVDGTSLTICDVENGTDDSSGWFTFMLIAHTQQSVIIPQKEVGDLVNLEADVLAKMVEKSLSALTDKLDQRVKQLEDIIQGIKSK